MSRVCWEGWVDYSPILSPEPMPQPLNAISVTWYLDWSVKLKQVPVTSSSMAETLTTEHPPPLHVCLFLLSVSTSEFQSCPDYGHAFWFGWITDYDCRFAFEIYTNLNPISHIIILFSYFLISTSHPTYFIDDPPQVQSTFQYKFFVVISDLWFLWAGTYSLQLRQWSSLHWAE